MRIKKKYVSPTCLFLGVISLGVSVFIGHYVVPYKVRENVEKNSKIEEGNARYEKWKALPDTVKLFQNIYIFNVTNPQEVVSGGKPVLQELGPYVYQQKRRKFDIVFNEANGTIFYREKTFYFFRPDLTNGSLSDEIITVNLPYMGTAFKASQVNILTRYVISETLERYPQEQLYVSTTVGKLLFEGTYLPFIQELAELNGEEILPNNTFGLYYGKNGSDQGRFEIFSGVNDPAKFGNVVSWNGMTRLDWWDDQYCNQINGSDGGVFRPFSSTDTVFQLFVPGLCKTFRFEYDDNDDEKEGLQVKGIPVLKFSVKPSAFQSPKDNPDNACYCVDPGKNFEKCQDSGVFPMQGCGKGAMILSQPHFYQGSQVYLNQSVGLNPQKERHEMALLIETYTSAPAKVTMRFQMNVLLKPIKYFRPLRNIPNMVHPVFWIDQTVELPDDSATLLRDKLYRTINITNFLTQVGIIGGVCLIIMSLVTFYLWTTKQPSEKETEAKNVGSVSYHPNGGVPNEKVLIMANGKLPNGVKPSETTNVTYQYQAEEGMPLLSKDSNQGPNGVGKSHAKESGFADLIPQQPQNDLNKVADSQLSPFPDLADFSSSSSIGPVGRMNNTRKELVEATSSYENL